MTNAELKYYATMSSMASDVSKSLSGDKWEVRRYEIAKCVVFGLCSNGTEDKEADKITDFAVKVADELINKLKTE